MNRTPTHPSLTRRTLLGGAAGAVGAAALLPACDHDHTHDDFEIDASIADVVFEAGATDEALLELLAKTATNDASQGTRFLAPSAGEQLDPATPVTFRWAVGAASASSGGVAAPPRDPRRHARSDGRAPAPPGLLERALGSALGVRVAHAHGTPVDGRAYFLVFRAPGNDKLLRVFTTRLDYTPSSEAWAKLTADASATITASIVGAIFEQNRIPADAGPWLGQELSFGFAG